MNQFTNNKDIKKVLVLLESTKYDFGGSIYGGAEKSSEDETATEDSTDTKPVKKSAVKQDETSSILDLAKKSFGEPDSIKGKQYNFKIASKLKIDEIPDHMKAMMRDIKQEFIKACKKNGIDVKTIEVKFLLGKDACYIAIEDKTSQKVKESDDDDETRCEVCGRLHNYAPGGNVSDLCQKCSKKTDKFKIKEAGVGIITKQNTTPDVKPGETAKQAAKFGNKLGRIAKPNGKI